MIAAFQLILAHESLVTLLEIEAISEFEVAVWTHLLEELPRLPSWLEVLAVLALHVMNRGVDAPVEDRARHTTGLSRLAVFHYATEVSLICLFMPLRGL